MTRCCRLVGIPCNYSLSTAAYWHLQFTRPGGLLMTAALSKFPGTVISEISSKNNQFSRSQLQQVNFPHILEGEKKPKNAKPAQQRMLSSVQSLSPVWLFVTAARQASLSITDSQSLLKLLSSWWCHPTILSSVTPVSSCFQSFQASGSFPVSQFFPSGSQSTGVSASASVLPMNIQDWFPLGLTGLNSLQVSTIT